MKDQINQIKLFGDAIGKRYAGSIVLSLAKYEQIVLSLRGCIGHCSPPIFRIAELDDNGRMSFGGIELSRINVEFISRYNILKMTCRAISTQGKRGTD